VSLIRHSAWSAGSAIAMMGSRFALLALLARHMEPAVFGVFAYSQWLVEITFLVVNLGATGTIARYSAEYRHMPSFAASLLRSWRPYSLLLPMVGALATVAAAGLSRVHGSSAEYSLLLVWAFANGVRAMHEAALAGLQRFDLVFRSNFMCGVLMLAGSLSTLTFPSLQRAYLIMAVAAGASCVVGISSIWSDTGGPADPLPKRAVSEIRQYAVRIWITAVLWNLVWSRGEVPILRHELGDPAVARYAVALSLYGGAVAAVMLGIGGLAPQITRMRVEESEVAAAGLCRRAMDLQLLICGLAASFIVWFSPDLMSAFYGHKYTASAGFLVVLAIGLPAMSLATHNHLLQISTGANYSLYSTLIGAVALAGIAYVGISIEGEIGAAMARSAVVLSLGLATAVISRRRWGVGSVSFGNLSSVSICLACSGCVVIYLPDELHTFRLLGFTVAAVGLALSIRGRSNQPVALYVTQRILASQR
jgi:O-antigen/teichoic acid export membrane protein